MIYINFHSYWSITYCNNHNENLFEIQNYLLKFASCYNEIGDFLNDNNIEDNEKQSYNFINILCVGRNQTGKSTFINNFFDERKCNVGGENKSKTQRINAYSDTKRHIRIYDTVGFEDSISTNKIIKLLQMLDVELVNCKQRIHLILYFIQDKTANFEKQEYEVFNEIVKYKTHIIFIQTKCDNNSDEKYQREKNKLYLNIKRIYKDKESELLKNKKTQLKDLNDLRDLYARIILCKHENFILMNQRIDIDSDQTTFGMDKLYKAIYNYIKEYIIRIEDMSKIEGLFFQNENEKGRNKIKLEKNEEYVYLHHPIYTIIKDNLFLGPYKTINDILCYINYEKKWIISRNAFYAALSGANPIPFVDIGTYYLVEKKLKKELAKLYHFDLEKNILMNDKRTISKEDINKIEEANKEKNEVHVKSQGIVNTGKGTFQGIKIGIEIADIVHDASYINSFKNAITAFANGCKSSILFFAIGSLIGGILNVGLIIYQGNRFSKYFEENLIEDNGVNFLTEASNDYNNAINFFKKRAEKNEGKRKRSSSVHHRPNIYVDM